MKKKMNLHTKRAIEGNFLVSNPPKARCIYFKNLVQ